MLTLVSGSGSWESPASAIGRSYATMNALTMASSHRHPSPGTDDFAPSVVRLLHDVAACGTEDDICSPFPDHVHMTCAAGADDICSPFPREENLVIDTSALESSDNNSKKTATIIAASFGLAGVVLCALAIGVCYSRTSGAADVVTSKASGVMMTSSRSSGPPVNTIDVESTPGTSSTMEGAMAIGDSMVGAAAELSSRVTAGMAAVASTSPLDGLSMGSSRSYSRRGTSRKTPSSEGLVRTPAETDVMTPPQPRRLDGQLGESPTPASLRAEQEMRT